MTSGEFRNYGWGYQDGIRIIGVGVTLWLASSTDCSARYQLILDGTVVALFKLSNYDTRNSR